MGLSAWKRAGDAQRPLRVNPSSGNLHPTEAYLRVGAVEGLEAAFHALHHRPDGSWPSRSAASMPGWTPSSVPKRAKGSKQTSGSAVASTKPGPSPTRFTRFGDDPNVPIDNSRHRWAVVIGVVSTARRRGLHSQAYLAWMFQRRGTRKNDVGLTAAQLTPAAFKRMLR